MFSGLTFEMKGLFRFSCLSILLILQIDSSISHTKLKTSIDVITNYNNCEFPQFDVSESYKYIDDQYRYDLCKKKFPDFDHDNQINRTFKRCLGPRNQLDAFHNPCVVVCPTANYFYRDDNEKDLCTPFLKAYTNLTRVIFLRDTNQECGPNHHCNAMGCCVKRETPTPITQKTTKAKQTPTTPTTLTTTPSTVSTTIPSTTPKTTPSAAPITPSLPPIHCRNVGSFKYPNDPSNRLYYSCVLKPELKSCPFNEVFDEKVSKCISVVTQTSTIASTPAIQTTRRFSQTETKRTTLGTTSSVTTTPKIDWKKYFHCTKEGFFKNPYDCTRFYRCYYNQGDKTNIIFADFYCPPNQIWDDNPGNNQDPTCVPREWYKERHGECKQEPLPPRLSYF